MNLREHFEKLHPVPEGVSWSDVLGMYACEFLAYQSAEKRQNGLWQGFQSGHAAGLEQQAKRIAELEASLADSNEALQVMGLKLAHAEGSIDAIGRLASHNIPPYAFGDNEAACDMAGRLSDIQNLSHSANTVATPVMDAAPAWEMMAIAWLRGKAAGQAQNNERWPDHAKCYPRWTLYVDIAQELANELEREHQKREDARTAGESDR